MIPAAQAVTTGSKIFNVDVDDFQTGLTIADGAITGTLTKTAAFSSTWGEGYFVALKFPTADLTTTDVYVGLDPSAGSGLVALDSDKDGLFKITNKNTQKFVVHVISKDAEFTKTTKYDLSGLTLQE